MVTKKLFTHRGHQYPYMNHAFNYAWLNERAVEVPIVQKVVNDCEAGRILEVGNVISHYSGMMYRVPTDIIDKYEINEATEEIVVNADIVNYSPAKRYKLIVSISTLEHVGYDEQVYGGSPHTQHPCKFVDTLDNIRLNLLEPKGKLVFTVPLGYNREMDKMIFCGVVNIDSVFYMHRISHDNRWQDCKLENVKDTRYGAPYQFANAIAICTLYGS